MSYNLYYLRELIIPIPKWANYITWHYSHHRWTICLWEKSPTWHHYCQTWVAGGRPQTRIIQFAGLVVEPPERGPSPTQCYRLVDYS